MVKTKLAERIFLVRFETQYELAATFLRIQEHYESSRFRNRVFTLEQYMDWYAATHGAFTYFEDWSGFNVPSAAFAEFYQGRFDPLSRKEERLLRLFRKERPPFYVIGLASDEDLKHELAHALFFTEPSYKEAALAAMRKYDTSPIEQELLDMGYHRAVIADEVQAYLVAPSGAVKATRARSLAGLRKELRANYRRCAAALSLE